MMIWFMRVMMLDDPRQASPYSSVSRFATSCSPRLEPLGFVLILPFVAILSFGPGMKNVRKWCCLFFLAHTLKYKGK